MSSEMTEKLEQELNDLRRNVSKPNLLLVGGTGVGKSSLLNYCFGRNMAQCGIGRPITKNLEQFQSEEFPLVIYDTVGYEIGKEDEFQENVIDVVLKDTAQAAERIHIAWYCISASGARLTDFDQNSIRKINEKNVPVCVVLTKADQVSEEDAEALKNTVRKAFPKISIFEVSVTDKQRDYDFKDLIAWSVQMLSDALKMAFVSAQKINIAAKKEEASRVIRQHSFGALTIGAAPIPFSDAPLLLASQTAMAARLIYIYELDGLDSKFTMLLKMAMTSALPTAGRYLAGEALKFIPVVGTIAGGLINAGVAATITFAFGHAVSEVCAKMAHLMVEKGIDEVNAYVKNIDGAFFSAFGQYMKKGLNKKSEDGAEAEG